MDLPIVSLTGIPGGKRFFLFISRRNSLSFSSFVIPNELILGIISFVGDAKLVGLSDGAFSFCGVTSVSTALVLSRRKAFAGVGFNGIHIPV
jgi:hypothetical protein